MRRRLMRERRFQGLGAEVKVEKVPVAPNLSQTVCLPYLAKSSLLYFYVVEWKRIYTVDFQM